MRLSKSGFLLAAPLLFLLAGCAEQAPQEDPGVEDIAPGGKSVITAPARQTDQDSVQERSI